MLYPSYPCEDLDIYEVGFSPECIKGLERVGVTLVRDIYDMAERFHGGGNPGSIPSETIKAYIEAAKHLHTINCWPWADDLEWFD